MHEARPLQAVRREVDASTHPRGRRVRRQAHIGDPEIKLREFPGHAFEPDHDVGRDRRSHRPEHAINRREPERHLRLEEAALDFAGRDLRFRCEPRPHLLVDGTRQAGTADATRGVRRHIIHRGDRWLEGNPLHGATRNPKLVGNPSGRLPRVEQRLHGVSI